VPNALESKVTKLVMIRCFIQACKEKDAIVQARTRQNANRPEERQRLDCESTRDAASLGAFHRPCVAHS